MINKLQGVIFLILNKYLTKNKKIKKEKNPNSVTNLKKLPRPSFKFKNFTKNFYR